MRFALPPILAAALLAATAPPPDDTGAMEAELAALINGYRQAQGLPPVPLSPSLTRVARLHVRDLELNRPDSGSDERGRGCNLHSWSAKGAWTPVCYTDDHRGKERMWSKPSEISAGAYSAPGFEISAGAPGFAMNPAQALGQWQRSRAHNAVILEQGIWNRPWRAMGVGIYGGYAVAWFGREPEE